MNKVAEPPRGNPKVMLTHITDQDGMGTDQAEAEPELAEVQEWNLSDLPRGQVLAGLPW